MDVDRLLLSAGSQAPVAGLTHGFYRYPARFSPQFARSAIEVFTKPGDTVLDPFMGGGTAAVEALSTGRNFVGSDLSSLSVFVTRTKTTPLDEADEKAVRQWATALRNTSVRSWSPRQEGWAKYQINLPWWIKQAIEISVSTADLLSNVRQREFARSAVLKTAQRALDCRDAVPSSREFLASVGANVAEMVGALRQFANSVTTAFDQKYLPRLHCRLVNCDAASLCAARSVPRSWMLPKLILTSPPYFGLHVLYHRWQVHGRRETPAPFWIAASLDGKGSSFYTFGDRQRRSMDTYIERLRDCFKSVARLMDKKSTLVQLVAFSNPDVQLTPYLEAMESAGLSERILAAQQTRFWRTVPNRKWYAKYRSEGPGSKELLLVHKLK
jgi:adenine-specific DNA methylase